MEIQPPSYADVRLIMGDQRSGKNNTAVAYAKDDYYAQLNGLVAPNGHLFTARGLDRADKEYLKECQIFPDVFKYVRVFTPDSKQSKVVCVPQGWTVASPVKIFANFHIYGMKAAYVEITDLLQYMNSDLFTNAWVLSDESAWTDPRNSMTSVGKLVAQFAATIGKRNVHFCQLTQFNNMIELRLRLFATMTVLCSYDERTRMITCEIKERGKQSKSVSYYAPRYWMNFNTSERVRVPEMQIARALQTVAY